MIRIKTLLIGILLSCFSLGFTMVLAQESEPLLPDPSPAAQIEYALPYPGILPGHPLYIFKQTRDTILLLLITNPVRKGEFYLLTADKHLNMAVRLSENHEDKKMIETLEKDIEYLTDGQTLLFETSVEKYPEIRSLRDRYEKSLLKHQEVIGTLQISIDSSLSARMDAVSDTVYALSTDFSRKK